MNSRSISGPPGWQWRSTLLLTAAAATFAAWVFLHLPATWGTEWIINRFGFQTYETGIRAIAVAMALVCFAWIWAGERSLTSPVSSTAGVLLLFVAGAHTLLMVAPVEYVHLPQYAAIAVLLGLAGLRPEMAWGASVALGAIDEAHQLLFLRSGRPDYFDWNDIVLNAIGAAFGIAVRLAGSAPPRRAVVSRTWFWRTSVLGLTVSLLAASPSISPFLTETARGGRFRILSGSEATVLLVALWWTLRRMLVSKRPVYDRASVVREAKSTWVQT